MKKFCCLLFLFFFLTLAGRVSAYVPDSSYPACPASATCTEANPGNCCSTTGGSCFSGSTAWTHYYNWQCVENIKNSCEYAYQSTNCNAADTCYSGNKGLNSGLCTNDGCGIGGIYKTCCNGNVAEACNGGEHTGTCPNTTVFGTGTSADCVAPGTPTPTGAPPVCTPCTWCTNSTQCAASGMSWTAGGCCAVAGDGCCAPAPTTPECGAGDAWCFNGGKCCRSAASVADGSCNCTPCSWPPISCDIASCPTWRRLYSSSCNNCGFSSGDSFSIEAQADAASCQAQIASGTTVNYRFVTGGLNYGGCVRNVSVNWGDGTPNTTILSPNGGDRCLTISSGDTFNFTHTYINSGSINLTYQAHVSAETYQENEANCKVSHWYPNVFCLNRTVLPPAPTPTPTPMPINGACGTTHYNCTKGTNPSGSNTGGTNVSGATAWTWNCNGLYGGTTASCLENKPTPPAGTCGAFNTANATTPVKWDWTNGTGLQVYDDTGKWWANIGSITSPYTVTKDNNNLGATPGIPPGRMVYARTTNNFIDFSTWGSITCPLPANQQCVVSGFLRQKSGSGCYVADASHSFNISAITGSIVSGDSCVSANCTASPSKPAATSYSCTAIWDNAGCVAQGRQPNTAQTLNLNISSTGYDNGQFSNAGCALNSNQLPITAGCSQSVDVALNFTGVNWVKVKNTSFLSSVTSAVAIPAFVNPFDSDDDGSPYFIIGEAGSALGVAVSPSTAYSASPRNWNNSSYTKSVSTDPADFINYVKSRKEYVTINGLGANIQSGKINIISGAQTIADADLANAPYVLVVDGNVTINSNFNNTAPFKSVAILSTGTLTFGANAKFANGIFIAPSIVINNTADGSGLKIKGNLITVSRSSLSFTNSRVRSDTSIPSLFVVFDPAMYLDLPYLSISKYNWQQLQ